MAHQQVRSISSGLVFPVLVGRVDLVPAHKIIEHHDKRQHQPVVESMAASS